MEDKTCKNCEYFDAVYRDCLNSWSSPRFQTEPDLTCGGFVPSSTDGEECDYYLDSKY